MKKASFVPGWGFTQDIWSGILKHLDCNPSFSSWSKPLFLANNIFIGYSLGGLLALEAAIDHGIKKLVLISSTARMPEAPPYEGIDPALLKAMRFRLKNDRTGLIEDFARLCTIEKDQNFIDLALEQSRIFSNQELSEGLRKLEAMDLRRQLGDVEAQTLIIHGSKDKVIPFSQALFLEKYLRSAKLVSLNGGHDIIISHVEAIAEQIETFLAHD